MSTFGQTLRGEREDRGLTIAELSERMGVDRDRLVALERNDFRVLPDDATMVPLLRTYADCLGVEAELMIADYRRERDRCLEQLDRNVDRTLPAGPPLTTTGVERPAGVPRIVLFSVVAVVAVGFLAWWIFAGRPAGGETDPAKPDTVNTATPTTVTAPVETTPTRENALPREAEPSREPAAPRAAPVAASGLTVPRHGVGTGVRNRELVGERQRFRQGDRVWFWTEIHGGSPGDRVEHVWLAGGVESTRVRLELGGPRWRTYSAKTLHSGTAGEWAVEVRDPAGRVLARREFDVTR